MVQVFLAEGFEEMEALGTADVLRRAGIETKLISVTGDLFVSGSHGMAVKADGLFSAAEAAAADMIVFPGGLPGATNLDAHEELMAVMEQRVKAGKTVAAICAAPMLLGKRGLLAGRRATCYPGFDKYLTDAVYTGQPVEEDGNIITGKGPGFVFVFALALVGRLKGTDVAGQVKAGLLLA